MRDNQLQAVERYLHIHFPNREILQDYDFDRGAQSFKVILERESLLLKVTETYLDDHQDIDILEALDRLEAGEALERTRGTGDGVIVTTAGLRIFHRG